MSTEKMDATGKTIDGRKHTASLEHTVKFSSVATPKSTDGKGNPYEPTENRRSELRKQVSLSVVPTPMAGTPAQNGSKLVAVSTPSSRDWKETSGMSETGVDPDGSIRSRLDQLPRQAQLAASGQTATGVLGCSWPGCAVDDIDVLTLDHVQDDGATHRKTVGSGAATYAFVKRNNFPIGFQTLCMNHQFKKELARKRETSKQRLLAA